MSNESLWLIVAGIAKKLQFAAEARGCLPVCDAVHWHELTYRLSVYVLPFHPSDYPPKKHGWKFFIVCKDKMGEESDFFDAIDALGEARESDVLVMLEKYAILAASGEPWQKLFPDRRKMHHVGEFNLNNLDGSFSKEKVWEFKHADLRVLWCYGGPNKIIIFGHVLAKDQNKIDPADVKTVQKVMQAYTTALQQGTIQVAGGEENEQAHGSLFAKGTTGSEIQKQKTPRKVRR